MQYDILLLLIEYVLYAKGLVGQNVRQAYEGEFPYVVGIKLVNDSNSEPEKDFLCTGALVSSKDVLTIAHNIKLFSEDTLEVVVGSVDLRQGQKVKVSWVLTYYDWTEIRNVQTDNTIDLSVIRLVRSVSCTWIILSPLSTKDLYTLDVSTAGWGDNIDDETPRFMETADLTILSKKHCKSRIMKIAQRETKVHKKYLCTSVKPYAFLRKGDSGGPLIYDGQLVGINKGTCPLPEDNYHRKKVNVHTGIADYRQFITDIMYNF